MKKYFILTLVFGFGFFTYAQTLQEVELELERLGLNSIQLRTEEERLAASDTFSILLDDLLNSKEAFNYPFDRVKNLSKLTSPDDNFRIFSWSVPLKDGRFAYYGRILTFKNEKYISTYLVDDAVNTENAEYQLLKPSNWYGAIYYDILKHKENGITYYSLIGYRPDNSSHNEKIIDVISTENLERLRFGAKIFNTPLLNGEKYERPPHRLIFRYNPRVVALLRYNPNEKKIIFDHLVPPDASMKKQWQLYGPDFSYDALYWKDGMWQLEESIEIKGDTKPSEAQPVQQGLPKK